MTALLDTIPPVPVDYQLSHRHLVDEATWLRLVNRIIKDDFGGNPDARGLAERIMDQALGFLALCVLEPEGHYGPSPIVDIGWHTFILYTPEYAAWCKQQCRQYFWKSLRQAWRLRNWQPGYCQGVWRLFRRTFIHHCPSDMPGRVYSTGGISHTVKAMRRHGLTVDEVLWGKEAECGLGGENRLESDTRCNRCGDGDTGGECSVRPPAA